MFALPTKILHLRQWATGCNAEASTFRPQTQWQDCKRYKRRECACHGKNCKAAKASAKRFNAHPQILSILEKSPKDEVGGIRSMGHNILCHDHIHGVVLNAVNIAVGGSGY